VVPSLDTGIFTADCKATIAFGGGGLVVAGCANAAPTPSVLVHALDGSGPSATILASSKPGLWLDHAHTHALVQDGTASTVRALAGAGPIAIDEPVVQAAFSSDDTKVLYMTKSGVVKRATASAATTPITLAPSALSILTLSSDARYAVIATTGDPSKSDTDLVLVDATNPASPRTLAPQKAASYGFSSDGTKYVFLDNLGIGLEGKLWVVDLPSGAPQKLSDDAERVVFDGGVVYWQELDQAAKSNRLRAARVASPSAVVDVDTGLDALTAIAAVAGGKLYVGSKLGLWEYPALAP
jgi:hypothetical protein